MNKDSSIRDAQIRYLKALERQPRLARNTYKGVAVIENGFVCNYTQGEHSLVMDMSKTVGGDEKGPSPGFFARAAIAGCVSMGVKQAAIKEGLVINSISVEIEADSADGVSLGFGEESAAPLETRLHIRIESDAPKPKILAMVDRALEKDPWFLALRDEQTVKTSVVVDQ